MAGKVRRRKLDLHQQSIVLGVVASKQPASNRNHNCSYSYITIAIGVPLKSRRTNNEETMKKEYSFACTIIVKLSRRITYD